MLFPSFFATECPIPNRCMVSLLPCIAIQWSHMEKTLYPYSLNASSGVTLHPAWHVAVLSPWPFPRMRLAAGCSLYNHDLPCFAARHGGLQVWQSRSSVTLISLLSVYSGMLGIICRPGLCHCFRRVRCSRCLDTFGSSCSS